MPETLEFDVYHEYSLFEIGITVDLVLQLGDLKVDVIAKIDTGSTFCVFE
jgi:hypothetical protein